MSFVYFHAAFTRRMNVIVVLLLLIFVANSAFAARTKWQLAPSAVEVSWDGSLTPATFSSAGSACVISNRNNNISTKSFGVVTDYEGGDFSTISAIPFVLPSLGVSGDDLPITITYDGVTLSNQSWTGNTAFTGGGNINTNTCGDPGDFNLVVNTADLLTVTGGETYERSFDFCAVVGNNSNRPGRCADSTPRGVGDRRYGEATTVTFTVNVAEQVKISGLSDMDLGTFTGANLSSSDAFCVGSNSGNGIEITLDSESAGGGYNLTGDNFPLGPLIPYTVSLVTLSGTESPTEGVSEVWASNQVTNLACAADITLTIGVASSAVSQAEDSSYSDKLTVTIGPN